MNSHEMRQWRRLARTWRTVSPTPEPPRELRRRILDAVEPGRSGSWSWSPVSGLALAASVALVAVVGGVMSWQMQATTELPSEQGLVTKPMYPVQARDIQLDAGSPCARAYECLGPEHEVRPSDLPGRE